MGPKSLYLATPLVFTFAKNGKKKLKTGHIACIRVCNAYAYATHYSVNMNSEVHIVT